MAFGFLELVGFLMICFVGVGVPLRNSLEMPLMVDCCGLTVACVAVKGAKEIEI